MHRDKIYILYIVKWSSMIHNLYGWFEIIHASGLTAHELPLNEQTPSLSTNKGQQASKHIYVGLNPMEGDAHLVSFFWGFGHGYLSYLLFCTQLLTDGQYGQLGQ